LQNSGIVAVLNQTEINKLDNCRCVPCMDERERWTNVCIFYMP